MELERTLTSNEVARMVDRPHNDLMKDIRRIIKHLGEGKKSQSSSVGEGKIDSSDFFIESTYKNEQNKVLPNYLLTKKGCELYSTRMTGAKGTQFAVAYIEAFNKMENHIKSNKKVLDQPNDLEIKRINAEARLENAKVRKAKLLSELSKATTNEVNKVLLEDKAVEVLTGKKMLEMPVMKEKLYDCNEIAIKLGILSKNNKPHEVAVSQIINLKVEVEENEADIFPVTTKHWGGTIMKYSQSVIDKVQLWLEKNNYPSIIQGESKKYHVFYKHTNIA